MIVKHGRDLSVGAALWILNVQYFIVQVIAAATWTKGTGYNWANNTISDLANTRCGFYGSRFVCSPAHVAMNISFMVLGITIIGGALLLGKRLTSDLIGRLGFLCIAATGVGAILIGLFPENSVSALHTAGATLSFLLGNTGMIVLGISLDRLPKRLRVYTVLSGIVGLVALVFFLENSYGGLGIGGMERIVAYPQTIWMIVCGGYLLLGHQAEDAR